MKVLRFFRQYVTAVLGFVYLITIGWVLPRHRAMIRRIGEHLGWIRPESLPEESNLPALSIAPCKAADLFAPGGEFRLLEMESADGNVSVLELAILAQLVRKFRPSVCFEIGTFDGRTALNFAANAPNDGVVYTLDLPRAAVSATELPLARGDAKYVDKETSGIRFVGTPYEKSIVQLYGDSATFDYAPYLGAVDLVFVDGAHSYEYVLRDTETALKLLREGRGLIVWHDYGSPFWKGVTAALNELRQKNPALKGMRHVETTTLVVASVGG